MSTAQDKHGTEIHPGDTVEVIYGGDSHHMVVDEINESGCGDHWILAGTITIHVPATATRHLRHADQPALKSPPPEGAPPPAPAAPPPAAALPSGSRPSGPPTVVAPRTNERKAKPASKGAAK